jgi:hypothetical protein
MVIGRQVPALLLALIWVSLAVSESAYAADKKRRRSPQIEDLGNQQYRVGAIEINKAARAFTVAGTIVRDAPPLEFLATTPGGHKSYESVLEINADAYQFNLACILIGLDTSKVIPPAQRDFSQPVEGDPVDVSFSWTANGKTMSAPASDFFLQGNPPRRVESNEWVYTGSVMLPNGEYLAHVTGTLLGVVHKGESIIEHRLGMGVGNYGSVQVNTELVPAVGSRVSMTVTSLVASPHTTND